MALDLPFVRRAKIANYASPDFFADDGMTREEVAIALAAEEGGKPLSTKAIARIEREALRKVRKLLAARGIRELGDVVP